MSEFGKVHSFKDYLDKCTQAYIENNLEEGLLMALKCYEIAIKSGSKVDMTAAVRTVYFFSKKVRDRTVNNIKKNVVEKELMTCSFCGHRKTENELTLGANVAICNDCVEDIYNGLLPSKGR
jgi:hypothetical protein